MNGENFIKTVRRTRKMALEVKGDILHLSAEDEKGCSFSLKGNGLSGGLKALLSDKTVEKYGYGLKEQFIRLAKFNLNLGGIKFDLQIAAHLLNIQLEELSLEDVFREKEILEKRLKQENLFSLFQDIEIPLIEVLADMEQTGIRVKKEILTGISEKLEKKKKELSREIYELSGESFNINSPKQLGLILFGKLGLPPVKKKKTGFSTDAEVLALLSKMHVLPKKILEYREISKLKSTYIDVLPRLIDAGDGRLHTSYNQTVTATGRLSSSNPNLQNIPIRSRWGKMLREAFSSASGDFFLLSADYSQIELRLLAHFSKDELLSKAFENDEDIHIQTAQEIFGLKSSKITADLRGMAKTINFGIIYGMSAYGLSRNLSIEESEAKDFIDRYFKKYQGVKRYIEEAAAKAKEKGYVITMFGRKRYLPGLSGYNRQKKEFALRVAVNTPLQGTAAEIIKLAMIKIREKFKKEKLTGKMILQIHDELIFEVPIGELTAVKRLVKEEMEKVVFLSVPLKVNLNAGRSWAEC